MPPKKQTPDSAPIGYEPVPIDFSAHPSTQFEYQIVKDSKNVDMVVLKRLSPDTLLVAQSPQFAIHFANNLVSAPFKIAAGKSIKNAGTPSHVVSCNLSTSFYKKQPGDVFITWCNQLDDMLVDIYVQYQRLLGKAGATREIIAVSSDRIFSQDVNKETGTQYPLCAKIKKTHKTDASVPITNIDGVTLNPTQVQNYDVVSATFMVDQPILTKDKRFRNSLVLLGVTQLGVPGQIPDPEVWVGYEGTFGSSDEDKEVKIQDELSKFNAKKQKIGI